MNKILYLLICFPVLAFCQRNEMDTIVLVGNTIIPLTYFENVNDTIITYNGFSNDKLNAVVLTEFNMVEYQKKETFINGIQYSKELVLNPYEKKALLNGKNLLKQKSKYISLASLKNSIDNSQLLFYIDENDFIRSFEFKDSLKISCINVELNLNSMQDVISTNEPCFSQIFKKEFNDKTESYSYSIYNRVILTEFHKNGIIEKRQFNLPKSTSNSNVYTIHYTNDGVKNEIYYSYIENNIQYKNGLYMKFYNNGNLFIRGIYSNNIPINTFEIFNEEGIKINDINFNTCKECKLPKR